MFLLCLCVGRLLFVEYQVLVYSEYANTRFNSKYNTWIFAAPAVSMMILKTEGSFGIRIDRNNLLFKMSGYSFKWYLICVNYLYLLYTYDYLQ